MENFKCIECDKEFTTIKGLSNHRFQKHQIRPQTTYNEFILKGDAPKCACGCGEEPTFLSITKGYREFIRGHASRINNNWGHNPQALKKSHETQRKMYESGELEIWNKGLTIDDPRVKSNIDKMLANPERNKKISKGLTGIKRSDEYKEKMSISQKKSWDNEEKRNKQRDNRINYIKNNPNKESNLESRFKGILDGLGFNYIFQYEICGYMFDFYLKDFDIVIEVDGDFWHCNPNTKHKEPIYESQKLTMKNDKKKNDICNKCGIKLIRFWEDDINNNLNDVINTLKSILV